MKDLANLYYFEKLLEDVNNDLVRQAQAKGDIAIGAVCFQIPEPLINLPGSFSVRLRAPRTGSIEMGTYYMSSMLCEGCRAILERAIEGGFNFLDCIIAPDACAQMNRCVERQHLIEKEKFFVEYSDVPMKNDETALRHFVKQMRLHVLEPLNNTYGIDISDDALKVADYNKKYNNADYIKLIKSDMFSSSECEQYKNEDNRFDVIVSNPPYIPTKDIDELSEEVRLHDPVLALDGDTDGLKFYKAITKQSVNYLKENGYLCYEIGYNQAEDVRNIMEQCGYSGIKVIKDLAGLDRVVIGRLNNIN